MNLRSTLAALALVCAGAGCSPTLGQLVMSPQLAEMTCPDAGLCIEDTARLPQARALRHAATQRVQARFGPFKTAPRVLFCTSAACSDRFAMGEAAALAIGTSGIVISHRGWQPYILRHEMIHHRQSEVFGVVETALVLPRWFIEGAAYTLSGDPRHPLPRQDIEIWRAQFKAYQARGHTWRDKP